jgi:hypothetical protein
MLLITHRNGRFTTWGDSYDIEDRRQDAQDAGYEVLDVREVGDGEVLVGVPYIHEPTDEDY